MSIQLVATGLAPSLSVVTATLQQVSATGAGGDYWNHSAGAWQSAPILADQQITLSETQGVYLATYSTKLGTVTSDVIVRILDDDVKVASWITRIVDGYEVKENALNISPKTVSPQRTWVLREQSDNVEATNVVVVSPSSSVTLAMDFRHVLNEGTGIQSVSSVTDGEPTPITASNQTVSQDAMAVHFDVAASELDAGEDGTFTVVAVTTDGQNIVGIGRLRVV